MLVSYIIQFLYFTHQFPLNIFILEDIKFCKCRFLLNSLFLHSGMSSCLITCQILQFRSSFTIEKNLFLHKSSEKDDKNVKIIIFWTLEINERLLEM